MTHICSRCRSHPATGQFNLCAECGPEVRRDSVLGGMMDVLVGLDEDQLDHVVALLAHLSGAIALQSFESIGIKSGSDSRRDRSHT
jgi:hypothetical protein